MFGLVNKARQLINRFSSTDVEILELGKNGLPSFWGLDIGTFQFNRHSFREFLQNGFGCNPYVYMVTKRIADVISELPVKFVDEITREDVEINKDITAFLELLRTGEGYKKLMTELSLYLSNTGNIFIHKKTAFGFEGGIPDTLAVLHVPDVKINTLNHEVWGKPISYDVENNLVRVIDADEVIHCAFANPIAHTNWGLSPLVSGQVVYDASNNEFFAESHLHKNMGADGIISRKATQGSLPMKPSEQKEIQRANDSRYAGARNFGKIITTNSSVDFTPIRLDPSKLKTLELNAKNLRIIAALYNLDSKIFSDPTASAFNNMKEVNVKAYEDAYVPQFNFISECLSKHLLQDVFDQKGVVMIANKEKIPILNTRDLKYEKELREQFNDGLLTKEEFRTFVHPQLGNIATIA